MPVQLRELLFRVASVQQLKKKLLPLSESLLRLH